jgi:polyisoprenoid-binding protein YceI
MKNKLKITAIAALSIALASFNINSKLTSSKTHVKFFSTTPAENIEANNYSTVSTIDTETGDVVFSVPMQSFEFEKALMQKHFNNKDFLDTKTYPKSKFVGSITNVSEINFEKDGNYNAKVKGELTIKDKTNSVNEKGIITIKNKKVNIHTKFNITLADYGISFSKGKPSSNIAKTVEVIVIAEY